jgi:DNA-binding transcriptional LysR family regulator
LSISPPPPGRLDWDKVRAFLAVARAGSLAAAAAALRVSEATVGRHLRALEGELGAPLFDRLPNRLAPTPLGRGLVEAAAAMEEEALRFERAARAGAAGPGEPVRVTATTSVALFVARHLDRVLAAVPAGVQLRLSGTRAPLSLARREAEIALRMRRPPGRGELSVRRVGSVAFSLYAARDHLARRGWAKGDGLGGLAFVGVRDDPESRQARWLDAAAAGVPMPLRLDEVPLRLEAARRGLGAALLPCFLGDGEPDLRRLLSPPPELDEEVYLLVHDDFRSVPAVRAAGTALAQLFREEAAALRGGGLSAGRSSATG